MEKTAREMTFEEEAVFFEEEARAEFAKETGNGDSAGVNNILRRGMRIIRKARQEIERLKSDKDKKNLEACCDLNYKAEYGRLLKANQELCKELECLKKDYESMETEFVRMRAQLDIVYLIFGGK